VTAAYRSGSLMESEVLVKKGEMKVCGKPDVCGGPARVPFFTCNKPYQGFFFPNLSAILTVAGSSRAARSPGHPLSRAGALGGGNGTALLQGKTRRCCALNGRRAEAPRNLPLNVSRIASARNHSQRPRHVRPVLHPLEGPRRPAARQRRAFRRFRRPAPGPIRQASTSWVRACSPCSLFRGDPGDVEEASAHRPSGCAGRGPPAFTIIVLPGQVRNRPRVDHAEPEAAARRSGAPAAGEPRGRPGPSHRPTRRARAWSPRLERRALGQPARRWGADHIPHVPSSRGRSPRTPRSCAQPPASWAASSTTCPGWWWSGRSLEHDEAPILRLSGPLGCGKTRSPLADSGTRRQPGRALAVDRPCGRPARASTSRGRCCASSSISPASATAAYDPWARPGAAGAPGPWRVAARRPRASGGDRRRRPARPLAGAVEGTRPAPAHPCASSSTTCRPPPPPTSRILDCPDRRVRGRGATSPASSSWAASAPRRFRYLVGRPLPEVEVANALLTGRPSPRLLQPAASSAVLLIARRGAATPGGDGRQLPLRPGGGVSRDDPAAAARME